jgi:hypothetical protein
MLSRARLGAKGGHVLGMGLGGSRPVGWTNW